LETVTHAPAPMPRPLGAGGDHAEAAVQTKAVP
jgi:hypothetical protein